METIISHGNAAGTETILSHGNAAGMVTTFSHGNIAGMAITRDLHSWMWWGYAHERFPDDAWLRIS